MIHASRSLVAALCLFALVGCGKSTKNDPTTTSAATAKAASAMKGSCNLRKEASTCSEETDKSDPMGLAKGLCDALKGTWSDGKCPQDSVVGSCVDKDGSNTYYYADGDAPRDLDSAKSSCEVLNEGKFTAIATATPPKAANDPPSPAAKTAKPTAAKKH
jgi:hypothetical protein